MDATSNGTYLLDDDGVFTSTNLPCIGTVIGPGNSVTVNVNFLMIDVGDVYSILQVYSNGGVGYTTFTRPTKTAPISLLEQSTNEGVCLMIPDCAIPLDGCTTQIDMGTSTGFIQNQVTIRFTNNVGSPLTITKSKPSEGDVLVATNPNTDLSEGLSIKPGDSSSASIYFYPRTATLNVDPVVDSGT